jgi:cytochrome c oxidase assembly factor CtaG/putative copper export protein
MADPQEPTLVHPLGTVIGVAVAVTAVAALAAGVTAPLALADPGALVRWGLPVASVTSTVASSATVGLLLLAAFLMPERARTERRVLATRLAGVTASVWSVWALTEVVLTFAGLAGTPPTSGQFVAQLLEFAWTLETTRVLLISAGIALVVALGALLARERSAMAWLAVGAVAAVVVLALTGHSAGSASHESAVNGLAVHLLGVIVWVGGLLALLVMRGALGRDLGPTVARFSVLAGWAFAAVALSGLLQTSIRLEGPADLGTPYGILVLAKSALLLVLGGFGWWHRRGIATRLTTDPGDGRAFARLAFAEVVLMGAAAGLAAVLARTPPPVADALAVSSRVLELTSYPDPGPMTGADWLFGWRLDWLFLTVAVLAAAGYLAGVVRLRRRGDTWPTWRVVLWLLGWMLFCWATFGGPGIWGRVLFSVHMVEHMTLAMIVPLCLVPAAPVTLALRTLPARGDRTWGPREVLLQVVHSRVMAVLANPVIAAVLFFASLAVFYWTGLFELALTTHTGHLLMVAHFLATGYLFVWVLVGTDPGVPRWSPLMLLVILFATISFHAFFGVALTGSESLLAEGFYTQVNLPWGPDPLADQQRGGEIAWGVGEAPTLVLAMLVAVQWFRRDTAMARRQDRKADRDGDADLGAYNAWLARLGEETDRGR